MPDNTTASATTTATGERELPVTSVWLTCQRPAREQRRGRYVPATTSHPGKMLPDLAAHAITTYTAPGELVLDPMCGSGITLVEAVRSGRPAIGVDIEARYTDLARANLRLAAQHGAPATGRVITGDATDLLALVPAKVRGKVSLVLTSPPYGRGTHGLVRATDEGVRKRDHVYGDRARGHVVESERRREAVAEHVAHHRVVPVVARVAQPEPGERRPLATQPPPLQAREERVIE